MQHGDGCRRRLSIRQTRSPKQARGFWCLFLKKARPLCDGAPRTRNPRFFSRDSPHAARLMRRAPRPPQPAILSPVILTPPAPPPLPSPSPPQTGPPSCASRSLFPARPMRAAWKGKANITRRLNPRSFSPSFVPTTHPLRTIPCPPVQRQAAACARKRPCRSLSPRWFNILNFHQSMLNLF